MGTKSAYYTLTLTLRSSQSLIYWYITDNNTSSKIFFQGKSSDFTKAGLQTMIQQNFSLPNQQTTYTFSLFNPSGSGIDCPNTNNFCYNLQLQNNSTETTTTLFIGNGNFTCLEQYYIGMYAPSLQKPLFQGCKTVPFYSLVYRPSNNFYFVTGIVISTVFVILFLYSCWKCRRERIQDEEAERRRREEDEMEREFQGKLNTTRKISIVSIVPRTILVERLHLSTMEKNTEIPFQPITDLEIMSCPICLDPYKVEDEICSSPNKACPHIYHTNCIIDWLLQDTQNDRQVCPMCRYDFLEQSS